MSFPWCPSGKESGCQCRKHRIDSWITQISWRREWLPTEVFLPGKSHGQRSLAGYSPWGHKDSDLIWQLNNKNNKEVEGWEVVSCFFRAVTKFKKLVKRAAIMTVPVYWVFTTCKTLSQELSIWYNDQNHLRWVIGWYPFYREVKSFARIHRRQWWRQDWDLDLCDSSGLNPYPGQPSSWLSCRKLKNARPRNKSDRPGWQRALSQLNEGICGCLESMPGRGTGVWSLGPFKRVFLKLGFTPKSNQGATEYGAWAQNCIRGTSLLVQWLRFHDPTQGAQVRSPGQGTRSHTPNWKKVCMPQLRPSAAKYIY